MIAWANATGALGATVLVHPADRQVVLRLVWPTGELRLVGRDLLMVAAAVTAALDELRRGASLRADEVEVVAGDG